MSANPAPMLFNRWTPDPVLMGIRIDTGFCRFRTPAGLDGLAKVDGGTLYILAVNAARPGRGDFRRFIAQAKEFFDAITVLVVFNDALADVLRRYAFFEFTQIDERLGEMRGLRWKKQTMRCDDCAPEFDCWNVSSKCRKPVGHSPRPPMVEDDDSPFTQ